MKKCKQCGRTLDESCFRPTKSRARGAAAATTGFSTLCRSCESLNSSAHQLMKRIDADLPFSRETHKRLVYHYTQMTAAGHPPLTAAARRLMGLEPIGRANEKNPLVTDADLLAHIAKIRHREYSSFDEADAAHRRLAERLRESGLYEDATTLLDEWWFEED